MALNRRRALLLTYGAFVLLALILAEAWVRLRSPYGVITPESIRARSLRYVPAVFARHVFSPDPVHAVPDLTKPDLTYEINAHGYRGRDFEARKPAGTVRIIIYGGSAAFDIYASDPLDWPRQVERLLRESGHASVEVINGGIPGHAAWDCLGRFFAEGHLFEPDIVALYEGWNDLKLFDSDAALLRRVRPHVEDEDPRLSYRNALDRWLCKLSQLYVRLRYRYYSHRLKATLEGRPPERQAGTISPRAVRQYRLTLETFVDVARRAGATPVLMTQARLVRADNTADEKSRIGYHRQPLSPAILSDAFNTLDATMAEVASANSVEHIDAAAGMKDPTAFVDHVHLSAKGSAQLATLTADALDAILRKRLGQRQRGGDR